MGDEEYGLKEGLRRTLMDFYKQYVLVPPEEMYSFLMDSMAPVRGGNGVSVLHLKKAFFANDLAKVEKALLGWSNKAFL